MLRAKVSLHEAVRMANSKVANAKNEEELKDAIKELARLSRAYSEGQREFIVEFS